MALWGDKDSKTASGTISGITSGGAVTGSSTSFTTQAKVGDYIVANGYSYLITAIGSITSATVEAGIPGGSIPVISSLTSYVLSEKPLYVSKAECDGSDAGIHGDPTKVYGVDVAEVTGGVDNVVSVAVQSGGTKYKEVPAVSFASGLAAATAAISGGAVTSITVSNGGSSYTTAPAVTVQAPFITFNGATNVDDTTDTITYTGHLFETGDAVVYSAGGGTAIDPLVEGETYYVVADEDTIQLAETYADATATSPVIIDLTDGVGASHKLTLTSGAATAVASLGSGNTVTHAGWVRRIVGTGGRAGRIQYETLVAGGTISGDAADDIQFPDA